MSDLFGVIHLPSLKSNSEHSLDEIIEYAVSQAILLDQLNYSGVIVENFGDGPFAKTQVDDIIIAILAVICHEVQQETGGKVGLNILRNATVQGMKIASVLNLDFVRSNIWEAAYVTDQGIIEGVASDVMEVKSRLNSDVEVYADIFVKHATPMADFSLIEAAEQALDRGGADRVIVSGRHTGDTIDLSNLDTLNEVGIYPMIGSGLKHDDVPKYAKKISGAIVGTAIKQNGVQSPINTDKATRLSDLWREHFF